MAASISVRIVGAIILFALALGIYSPRAAVSPQESDGAEYATAAVTGTLVHPPGYPLYMAGARFIVSQRLENPYAVLAQSSSVLQALSVALLFILGCYVSRSLPLAVATSVAWLFYEPSIRNATDTEVFALQHVLILCALFCIFRAQRAATIINLVVAGLLFGIAGSHHSTSILWGPLALAMLITSAKDTKQFAVHFSLFTIAACLGLSPFLLLLGTPGNLSWSALESLSQLISFVLRTDYGTFSLKAGYDPSDISYFGHFLSFGLRQLTLFTICAVPLLVVALKKSQNNFIMGMLASVLLHLLFAANLVAPDRKEVFADFLMRFYPIASLPLLLAMLQALGNLKIPLLWQGLISLAIVAPLLGTAQTALESSDNRKDLTIGLETQTILAELPPNAVFISLLDRTSMGVLYQQKVFNKRPDVLLVVGSLVRKANYFSQLQQQAPFLKNLSSTQFEITELIRAAHKDARSVFALSESEAPTGLAALPLGVTSELLVESRQISTTDMAQRLLKFCTLFPDGLGGISRNREHSRLIIGKVFLSPLRQTLGLLPDPKSKEELKSGIQSFLNGDLTKLRESCLKILETSSSPVKNRR